MTNAEIRAALEARVDPAYREFTARLLPGTDDLLGVRLPELRALARRIAREGAAEYLAGASDASMEERLLQGLVIGYAKLDADARRDALERFLPKIDSWSVCDSACTTCKFFAKAPEAWFAWLAACARRPEEYQARFGLVSLLDHFVRPGPESARSVLAVCAEVRNEAHYARMANAWTIAECAAVVPDDVVVLLRDGGLDEFTRRMAIRKACESYRISAEDKERFRVLRTAKA